MPDTDLRTAGVGGPETEACIAFGDDIYEVVCLVFATVNNTDRLQQTGAQFDSHVFGPAFFEMCLCRAVDACLTYVSNVLRLIFREQPSALKSSGKVEIGFVLQYRSMDDLIAALLERRVYELSYRSLDDLDKFLADSLGIALFRNSEARSRAVRIVDVRNLIVHNRGIVNEMFKRRHPDSSEVLGERRRYYASSSLAELLFLVDWIMDLDVRMIEKFHLPAKPRVPRPKVEFDGPIVTG